MNKKLLLILLVPMALMGMREPIDPSTIHDPCEDSMAWQAASLAGKRVKDDFKEIAAGASAVFYAVKGAYAAMFLLKTHAVKAVLLKAALTKTAVSPAMVAAAAGKITALSSISAVSAATGAIGAVGAAAIARETWYWAGDVKKAKDSKDTYLAEKKQLIEEFKLFKEKQKERRGFVNMLAKTFARA